MRQLALAWLEVAVSGDVFTLPTLMERWHYSGSGPRRPPHRWNCTPAIGQPGGANGAHRLAGQTDIRELIAFPKTKAAADPMTNAPSPVDPRQLRELHIAVTE